MSQPPTYNRQYNFTGFSTTNPSDQQPGTQLDAEFNAAKATLDATLNNLALLQRDDGALANEIVTAASLADSALALMGSNFNYRGDWATATSYAPFDIYLYSSELYIVLVSHVSSAVATDLASHKVFGPAFGAGGGGGTAYVDKTGDTMTGKLVLPVGGLKITPGTTPSSPANGDFWVESGGVYAQVGGSTVRLDNVTSTGGWTQIDSKTFTSGDHEMAFTSIPQTYSDLYLEFNGLYFTAAGPYGVFISVQDGTTYTASFNVMGAGGLGTSPGYGAAYFPGYRANSGVISGSISAMGASPTMATVSNADAAWRVTGGVKAIKVSQATGSFAAGTCTLYGR